jgi:hypothetical protein
MTQGTTVARAVRWLGARLANGAVPARTIEREWRQQGGKRWALWRARRVLGVLWEQPGQQGRRGRAPSIWALTADDLAAGTSEPVTVHLEPAPPRAWRPSWL